MIEIATEGEPAEPREVQVGGGLCLPATLPVLPLR